MLLPEIPILVPRQVFHKTGSHIDVNLTPGEPLFRYTIPPEIIYHYTSADIGKLILSNRQLKFSSAHTFNDPFDMHEGLLDLNFAKGDKKLFLREINTNKPRKVKREIQKNINKTQTETLKKAQRLSVEEMRRTCGVCCFSESSDVALMWSHYAKKHEGVCLGFSFEPVSVIGDIILTINKVEYKDKITPINYYKHRDAAVQNWLSTKSEVWNYEKEVRAFIHDRKDKELFMFERLCLKEIYFGCRTSETDKKELITLLDHPGYKQVIKKEMIIDPAIFNVRAIDL